MRNCLLLLTLCSFTVTTAMVAGAGELEVAGVTVTPHSIAEAMRYGRDPDPELGARVQLFLRNASQVPVRLDHQADIRLRGRSPEQLLEQGDWAWHDFPSAWPDRPLELPPGAMTVWSFNSKRSDWGVDTVAEFTIEQAAESPSLQATLSIDEPDAWISSVTFFSESESVIPDRMIVHVTNAGTIPFELTGYRLWLPESNASWRALQPGPISSEFESWPPGRMLGPGAKGMLRASTGSLPLSYAAVELQVRDAEGRDRSIWGHLRVKREVFDISGGWVQGGRHASRVMTFEPFLKTLRRMHINTAHISDAIAGYTDQTAPDGLYTRYPLKFFSKLTPVEHYETTDMLPRVHAVEFLGEPQYGGGRPVAPMEVWTELAPYQSTQLPTTLTHSEERIWRYYAGLSDYPHYDAYRVCAPSPDAWQRYDRWGGVKLLWGAPLETIGDMSRSLRDLNRPMPTAYWSQGPHHGWGPMWGRRRASPTGDELRLQAYHALSSRITSLYWFNLSLASLVKYRDTLDELTRVGREMRMLEDYCLWGDAYRYERKLRDGQLDWDLASIVAPQGALLFALDLDYQPDKAERVFQFGPPREARLAFALPSWLHQAAEVFRVDADGCHEVRYEWTEEGIEIADTLSKVGIYVVAPQQGTRHALEHKHSQLVEFENSFDFDPASDDDDFAVLVEFAQELRE